MTQFRHTRIVPAACRDCDEVLYKNTAYDVLEDVETGEFAELIGDGYESL